MENRLSLRGFVRNVLTVTALFALLTSMTPLSNGARVVTGRAGEVQVQYLLGVTPDAEITLTNTSDAEALVKLSALNADGLKSVAPTQFVLSARSSKRLSAGSLFEGTATLEIESHGAVKADAFVQGADMQMADYVFGQPPRGDPGVLIFPSLTRGDALAKRLVIFNVAGEAVSPTAVAFNAVGAEIARATLGPLLSMQTLEVKPAALFSWLQPAEIAAVEIQSDLPLAGRQVVAVPGGDVLSLAAAAAGGTSCFFRTPSHFGAKRVSHTLSIFNTNDFVISVTAEAFTVEGKSLGVVAAAPVPAKSSVALSGLGGNKLPEGTDSVRVESDGPISGYSVIGVVGDHGLTALPAWEEHETGSVIEFRGNGRALAARLAGAGVPAVEDPAGMEGDVLPDSTPPKSRMPATDFAVASAMSSAMAQTLKLTFPVRGQSPYSVRMTSVLDHHRSTGIVVAYTGERGLKANGTQTYSGGQLGYANTSKVVAQLNGNYKDKFLWYEHNTYQHPGYDFGVPGTIIAPADGDLIIPATDRYNGSSSKTPWATFHVFKIRHDNGEESWFLHASRFVNKQENGSRDLDALARAAFRAANVPYDAPTPTQMRSDIKVARVTRGEAVALIGSHGAGNAIHLHYELRDAGGNLLDPYGWEGGAADPLANNSSEPRWLNVTRPTVDSAVLNMQARTLTVTGQNFQQSGAPKVELWRPFENTTDSRNANDGTLIKPYSALSYNNGQIVVSADDALIGALSSGVIKVAIPSGPRSSPRRMTQGTSSSPPRPVVSASLMLGGSAPYTVGKALNIKFSVTNRGGQAIKFQRLLAGGRLNGDTNCAGGCPDFPSVTGLTLNPGQTYSYDQSQTFSRAGTYEFFAAYQLPDGSWVTNLDADTGVAKTVRVTLQPASNPPTASFTMSGDGRSAVNGQVLSYSVPAGGTVRVSFDAARSTAGSGTLTSFEWKSNGSVISNQKSFAFTFGPGTHNIGLWVRNSSGALATATATLQVVQQSVPPTSRISMSGGGQSGSEGQTLTFIVPTGGSVPMSFSASRSSAGSGQITGYEWRISTTLVSRAQSFNFVLGRGRHEVELTLVNSSGLRAATRATVVVNERAPAPPTARLTMSGGGQTGYEGQTLTYTVPKGGNVRMSFSASRSSGGGGSLSSYEWRISTTLVNRSDSFNFTLGRGRHDIDLTVVNSVGVRAAARATVIINER